MTTGSNVYHLSTIEQSQTIGGWDLVSTAQVF